MLQIRSDKRRFPPYGLAGGALGTPSANILNPGRNQVLLPTMGLSDIRRGDVLRHVMAGGGGWGDQLERDPELVRLDVHNEKLSAAYAFDVYGVVFRHPTGDVDVEATALRRQHLRAQV